MPSSNNYHFRYCLNLCPHHIIPCSCAFKSFLVIQFPCGFFDCRKLLCGRNVTPLNMVSATSSLVNPSNFSIITNFLLGMGVVFLVSSCKSTTKGCFWAKANNAHNKTLFPFVIWVCTIQKFTETCHQKMFHFCWSLPWHHTHLQTSKTSCLMVSHFVSKFFIGGSTTPFGLCKLKFCQHTPKCTNLCIACAWDLRNCKKAMTQLTFFFLVEGFSFPCMGGHNLHIFSLHFNSSIP